MTTEPTITINTLLAGADGSMETLAKQILNASRNILHPTLDATLQKWFEEKNFKLMAVAYLFTEYFAYSDSDFEFDLVTMRFDNFDTRLDSVDTYVAKCNAYKVAVDEEIIDTNFCSVYDEDFDAPLYSRFIESHWERFSEIADFCRQRCDPYTSFDEFIEKWKNFDSTATKALQEGTL